MGREREMVELRETEREQLFKKSSTINLIELSLGTFSRDNQAKELNGNLDSEDLEVLNSSFGELQEAKESNYLPISSALVGVMWVQSIFPSLVICLCSLLGPDC